jgi:hypothetical protein
LFFFDERHLLTIFEVHSMPIHRCVACDGVNSHGPYSFFASFVERVASSGDLYSSSLLTAVSCSCMQQFWLCLIVGIICTILEPVLGILGGTLASFLISAMTSSKNQHTCIVEDVYLPTIESLAYLRVVSVTGEVSFANAAAMVRIGTSDPNPSRTLLASDARNLSYVVASLADSSDMDNCRLSVGVQTQESQLRSIDILSQNIDVRVCILDLSRLTLVDIDGADAISTIGQQLTRLTKIVPQGSNSPNNSLAKSPVYVVVGNQAPKNLYSDMWLKRKFDDGYVFRSVQGAMRHWQYCIGNAEIIDV